MDSPTTSLPGRPAAHKRRQVADGLRKMIAELRSGDRLPSLSHLEKHYGVAKSTVEAAVHELEAEGLIVRRHGAGTFVAGGGREPGRARVGRMMITSVPLGQSLNIFSSMAAALEAEMRRMGYDALLYGETSSALRLRGAQERWEAGGVDGYIHIGSLEDDTVFPAVPGVVIGDVPGGAKVHQVAVDNYGGGRRAGEYLWDLGHRRVAFVATRYLLPGAARFRGFADSFVERGGREEDVRFACIESLAAGGGPPRLETVLRELLREGEPPTALFFANDQVAFPALQMLLAWGYRVPGDVAVLSFDDTPGLASQTRPALTSLRMPTLALAALAVQTLHQAILDPSLPFRHLLLPAELITRESSGPTPEPAA
ncbi:MAG TPA: GntR family transcriptional regulator [Armatimonadaceae bacterium]|nr:GntR family transcriptional regulator [Armatimonadaceae bacterium]